MHCKIVLSESYYEIEIGHGILDKQVDFLHTIASKFAIITDDIVGRLYGENLKEKLLALRLDVHLFSFPHQEQNKTRKTKEHLEDQLFEKGFGKDAAILALGGGVVTDMAGYLGATFCRGVPVVMMPTSLLAMVDASIGGKTAVNHPHGKNLVGCIWQPKKVVMDIDTLKTLPKKEFANGMVEMIKHALIADSKVFDELESVNVISSTSYLQKAIIDSVRIKKEIVEQDEKESGKRRILNFGHTIGHAIEKVTKYCISHGQAVAVGIMVESYLSMICGELKKASFERIKRLLIFYGQALTSKQRLDPQAIYKAMTQDKKAISAKPRFVLLQEIGLPQSFDDNFCTLIEDKWINRALDWMNNDLCCH